MNITPTRTTLVAAAIAACLSVGATACSKSPDTSTDTRSSSASEALSDTAITAQVKLKLATDSNIHASDITVTTIDGAVTLEGSVDDAAARSAAERTASSVTGVGRVYNQLSAPSSTMNAQDALSSTWITSKVKSLLLADSDANGLAVNVETEDGVVTLQGELDSRAAITHVKDIAAGVEGVRHVDVTAMTVASRR
jgi:hyperosmotically inducible protein